MCAYTPSLEFLTLKSEQKSCLLVFSHDGESFAKYNVQHGHPLEYETYSRQPNEAILPGILHWMSDDNRN